MELNASIRNTVYRMYFAPKGLTEDTTPIVLDGKRAADKVTYSKSFADGSKNRVALLAVCKEVCVNIRRVEQPHLAAERRRHPSYALQANSSQVNDEAASVLYNHPLRFESTALLGEFLAEYRTTRVKITNIEVKAFKKGARMALALLAEAPGLRRLRIEAGVSSDGDPRKAAKTFYTEISPLLTAIGKNKNDKHAAVGVIEFGKGAITSKIGDKAKNYDADMMESFTETLKKLCK